MSDDKAFNGKKFIDTFSIYKPLPNDNDVYAIIEFEKRICKNRYRLRNAPVQPLFLHHTISEDEYAPQTKFTWGGGHKDRIQMSAAHIVTDIKIWPLTLPAGLNALPLCGIPGCCKFSHLGLLTLSETRIWVNMNKEQKARRAYIRAQWAMFLAHDAERSKPGSYRARELASDAIKAETKYEELQLKYEEMSAKELVGVTASNLMQEHIVCSAVERMRTLYNKAMLVADKHVSSSLPEVTYDTVCRSMIKADADYLERHERERAAMKKQSTT